MPLILTKNAFIAGRHIVYSFNMECVNSQVNAKVFNLTLDVNVNLEMQCKQTGSSPTLE